MFNYLNEPSLPVGVEVAQATAGQEAAARAKGFKSYAEMLAWARQQQSARDAAAQGQGGPVPGGSRMPQTWDEAWGQLKMIHPKNMLDYVTSALGGGK